MGRHRTKINIDAMTYYSKHVFICTNQKDSGKKCCADLGGASFFHYMKEKLLAFNAHGPQKIRLSQSGCLGRCGEGPCLVIYPEGVWYTYQNFSDLDEIIDTHLLKEGRVLRLLLTGKTSITTP